MSCLELLKNEVNQPIPEICDMTKYFMYQGYARHLDQPVPVSRGYAAYALFTGCRPHIYNNDLIVGSIRGKYENTLGISQNELEYVKTLVDSYGSRTFSTNFDHYSPDYEGFLQNGIKGILENIDQAMEAFRRDGAPQKKLDFLKAARISMEGFAGMISSYGKEAIAMAEKSETDTKRNNFLKIAEICNKLASGKPEHFREALQLVWFAHIAFLLEGRYAMALGRLDQYLYPYYEADLNAGLITRKEALELLECTLYKIGESRLKGGDDVVNIAIGGLRRDGSGGVNELSYIILNAVKNCNIPGPNLSARIYEGIPDAFLDECLNVIGTGLGYPALMNDEVNIPALHRHGYLLEDCRDYSMVGCIENFITGRQPPWSDGRYNSPKYLELALNNGVCMLTGVQMGPKTGEVSEFETMEQFLKAVKEQMEYGAAVYMARFNNENGRYNTVAYSQPFLSCFCRGCIENGLDINDGGAVYPSVHGAGCMGIATMADSLAAIEKVIFQEKYVSLTELQQALRDNFQGYDLLRAKLKHAPKYGNNDDFVDRYAVWFVDVHEEIFSKYRTRDGGAIYTAIASNISNIPAGKVVAATPDGRGSGEPLSDAASPTHGADVNGPTAVVQSLSKPDYTKVSCGTVLNQKFSPNIFRDPSQLAKLRALIKVYFRKGGQEVQINAVSRDILKDAQAHPEKYRNLVVRVSGFSAYYIHLNTAVQNDILERTEHE